MLHYFKNSLWFAFCCQFQNWLVAVENSDGALLEKVGFLIADQKEFLNRDYIFQDNNFALLWNISLVSLICGIQWHSHSSGYSSLFWQRNDIVWLQVWLLSAAYAQCPFAVAAFHWVSFPLERLNCRFNYMVYLCRLVLGRLSSKPSGVREWCRKLHLHFTLGLVSTVRSLEVFFVLIEDK